MVLPLTATIVARNEADRIAEAIRSVSFAAEVLVLDDASEDGTREAAERAGARVVRAPDWPGFAGQKNRAAAMAAHDWVLSIDADERVDPDLARAIGALWARHPGGPPAAAYRVRRLNHWLGRPLRRGTWWPDRQVRLYDRRRARWAGREPHPRVVADGPVEDLPGVLLHHPYRSLSEQVRAQDRYAETWARAAAAEGLRAGWWDVALRPAAHLFRALVLKRGLLDGVPGLLVAGVGALYVLLKWGRLWLARHGGEGA